METRAAGALNATKEKVTVLSVHLELECEMVCNPWWLLVSGNTK